MNILVICQYYYPEPFKINDICEELVKKGHSIDVVTGTPNYPMGEIYKGYENEKKADEIINGVNVHRCKIIPRKKDPAHRLLNYFSYPRQATKYLKKMNKEYDVIFVYQLSPVIMAKPAIAYKKKYGTKVVLYCLDIWPESLKAGNVSEKSPLFKYFKKESEKIYTNCDKILVTSNCFIDYLHKEFKIDKKIITHAPQYAESFFKAKDCKKKQNKKIDLMFAGNLGKTQSLDTIIKAAEILKDNKDLFFHFVGDGAEYERLQNEAKEKELHNVIFYGRKPAEEMPKYYKKADAMLVTLQANSAVSNTLPGKVQTYMAAGKAIIGAIDGETKQVIDKAKCGYCGKAEDAEELADNIKKFIKNKNKTKLEENSINYNKTNFAKEKFIKTLNENLQRCAS